VMVAPRFQTVKREGWERENHVPLSKTNLGLCPGTRTWGRQQCQEGRGPPPRSTTKNDRTLKPYCLMMAL
jgi:hypothetical protein